MLIAGSSLSKKPIIIPMQDVLGVEMYSCNSVMAGALLAIE